ncbi:hypothetical protein OOT46_28800 [Aquabacterium sp. A7-Y]|uniref:hypothetical protein n=1 Tax=Aquabacterium sp. A7-Y TaxID=1349605 RepID=UPI00223DDFCD|nr:hypothetical protein [Aquabacterium sp. A7-Y]MCW7541802.1 hypothetical protein [Aquabacterium sp. A7-Y]
MRTAPALQLTVRPSGPWVLGVAALALGTVASLLAWLQLAPLPAGLGLVLGLVVVPAASLIAWLEWRRPPLHLHWDGRRWHWQAADAARPRACSGRVEVAADLGRWMLLRLWPDSPGAAGAGRGLWLPVQAAGLGPGWHALRCALYSPTPVADPLAATNPATDER